MSALNKIRNQLVNKGSKMSAKQISERYNVVNPYDLIYKLREEGYNIELVKSSKNTYKYHCVNH